MRRVRILRLLSTSKELAIEFCERCARVCDHGCRADAIRERAIAQRLRFGGRF
jgi:hypothetical protein